MRCSVKKDVLNSFKKSTGKHLCQSFFFKKVKKETQAMIFSCEFCDICKNNFFTECQGLFLKKVKKETQLQIFSCEFCDICKNNFFTEHL